MAGSALPKRSGGSSDYTRVMIMVHPCWPRQHHLPAQPLMDMDLMTAILLVMFRLLLLFPLLW